MRSIMMRHSQDQKYSNTDTTVASLPPKVCSQLAIFYLIEIHCACRLPRPNAKLASASPSMEGRSKYLTLIQKLSPLRIACAGGRVPLDDDGQSDDPVGDGDEETDEPKPTYVFKSNHKCTTARCVKSEEK